MTLRSTGELCSALRAARDVALLAYTLPPGPVEDALLAAAARGAHVCVRLEGRPYADARGGLALANRRAVERLARAGADARLVDTDPDAPAPIHAKALVADGALFLDDRNWTRGDATILRDTSVSDRRVVADAIDGRADAAHGRFAMRKRDALASEARLLQSAARGDDVAVASESFGAGNAVYAALDALARAGAAPRLLVNAHDAARNPREASALRRLQRDGVRVRLTADDEKFALAGARGWIGSANATAAFAQPDQLDWGLRSDARAVVGALRTRFEARWRAARPLA
ncbi:MAG: hypothetical protein KGN02_06195 [bacterium]|nr:hypothetical protein [bacterium]